MGGHLPNAQIARRLRISVRTVESHVAALLRKLDAAGWATSPNRLPSWPCPLPHQPIG
ncbi:LuxR C-terminal-related transcriptional regulator [Nonomuraea sp. JJY05]|uniref:LuxR C-terminal-related transcriptional regulator n=1 Tax=Nonomuraea sp. JJY05 TaxID=3350255 RepID=UPI00373EAAFC